MNTNTEAKMAGMAGMAGAECGNLRQVSICVEIDRLCSANNHAGENLIRIVNILERLRGCNPCNPEGSKQRQDGHIYALEDFISDYHEINIKIAESIEELERLVG